LCCIAFSPNGRLALSGGFDRTVRLWEVATGKQLLSLRGHEALVYGVAFSPDGQKALSGSFDTTVRLWRLPRPQVKSELRP
jgi:WD40 repeat protein